MATDDDPRAQIDALIASGALVQAGWRCNEAAVRGNPSDAGRLCAHAWPCGPTFVVAVRPTP